MGSLLPVLCSLGVDLFVGFRHVGWVVDEGMSYVDYGEIG